MVIRCAQSLFQIQYYDLRYKLHHRKKNVPQLPSPKVIQGFQFEDSFPYFKQLYTKLLIRRYQVDIQYSLNVYQYNRIWEICILFIWDLQMQKNSFITSPICQIQKKVFETIENTQQLFRKCFIQYHICLKCIFRIYTIESLTFYRDTSFYLELIAKIMGDQILQTYNILQNIHKSAINGSLCWLCQGTLQKMYINNVCQQIFKKIQKRGTTGIKTYKLNVKVPTILSLKYLLFLNILYYQLSHQHPDKTQLFYQVLLKPLQQQNGILQIKTILKWIISAQLNSNQELNLESTIVEDEYTLIISIDQDYTNKDNEKKIMNLFSVQLPAGKAMNPLKKIKLQHKDLKCTQANILKISKLSNQELIQMLQPLHKQQKLIKIIQGQFPPQKTQSNFTTSFEMLSINIYLSGKYIKFSRYLSQTPWVVSGKKLTPSSLQQQIQNPLLQFFYPGKKREQVEIKFHSGGREDIDVRMLQGGRPFVLEFVSPLRRLNQINQKQLLAKIDNCEDKQTLKLKELQLKDKMQDVTQKQKIIHYLQVLINSTNKDVKVKNFQEATVNYISNQLKAAQMEKVKHYICFIISQQPITNEDISKINEISDLVIHQKTPLRVLHRRTLMVRNKMVHKMVMHPVSIYSAVLQIWASAGTYIKQFIHGDLNRTIPNIGTIMGGKSLDILQLDVGGLKQGEWNAKNIEQMKMPKLQWQCE